MGLGIRVLFLNLKVKAVSERLGRLMPQRGMRHQMKSDEDHVFATWRRRIAPQRDTPTFRSLCGGWKMFHVESRDRHNVLNLLNLRGTELVQAVRKRRTATTGLFSGLVSGLAWRRGYSRLGQTATRRSGQQDSSREKNQTRTQAQTSLTLRTECYEAVAAVQMPKSRRSVAARNITAPPNQIKPLSLGFCRPRALYSQSFRPQLYAPHQTPLQP